MQALGIVAVTGLTVTQVKAEDIVVFAAASLKTALDDVIDPFENATSHRVLVSYAGSSALARQIQLGAPANLVLLANVDWMNALDQDGLLASDTRQSLLTNQLVLISSEDGPDIDIQTELTDQLGQDRLAMALVQAVPAGIYGRSALTSLGLWTGLAPQIAQTDNVRAALALVALGETPFGIVYFSDAQADPRVFVRAVFAPETHAQIEYPMAAIADQDTKPARAFLEYLNSDAAQSVFRANGFGIWPN